MSELIMYVPTILVCIFGGVTRTLLQESRQNVKSFISSIFMSAFVGIITYNVAMSYSLKQDATIVLCGVASFIADDILIGIKAIGHKIRTNPIGTLWAAFRVFIQKIIK